MEHTLPSAWYRDEAVFALEREHIFFKEWMCVGRESELPGPGSHRVQEVAGQSILLLRNSSSELRAFYNVCRHRGARLCVADGHRDVLRGGVTANGIVCPYHAWSYNLDGQLIKAPFLERTGDFNPADIRLHPVACAAWGGFVFVNLTPATAPDLAAAMTAVGERFQRYPLAALRCAKTLVYDVAANWKILCENYNECYHCGPVHPELCRVVPAFRERGGADLDWLRGVPHRAGADTFTRTGTSSRRSFPGLNADEQVRHKGELVYPNLMMSVAREHVAAFVLEPPSATRTRVLCHFLFEDYELGKPGFDPADAIDFWDLVNRQDWAICSEVQAGITARVHQVGLLAPMEDWNLDIRRYVSERIGAYVSV